VRREPVSTYTDTCATGAPVIHPSVGLLDVVATLLRDRPERSALAPVRSGDYASTSMDSALKCRVSGESSVGAPRLHRTAATVSVVAVGTPWYCQFASK
jgi:hypothetical protein